MIIMEFLANTLRISDRDRGFDYHPRHMSGTCGGSLNQLNYRFHSRCVKIVFLRIIVRRSCDHHDICRTVNFPGRIALIHHLIIQYTCQIQLFFCQIFFDIVILDRRDPVIDLLDLFLDDINSRNRIMLRQKRGNRKSYITCTGNRDL